MCMTAQSCAVIAHSCETSKVGSNPVRVANLSTLRRPRVRRQAVMLSSGGLTGTCLKIYSLVLHERPRRATIQVSNLSTISHESTNSRQDPPVGIALADADHHRRVVRAGGDIRRSKAGGG